MTKKTNYLPVLLSGIAAAGASVNAYAAKERPNIVVIVADDLGTHELGCYGGTNIATPNIDRLAREGIRMTNNYASCAMSVPIRASMYTGLYPVRHGSYRNHKPTYSHVKSITHYMPMTGYRLARTGKQHPAPKSVYQFEELPGFKVGCTAVDASYSTHGIEEFVNRNNDPFCMFVCSINSHRPWTSGEPEKIDPDKIALPPNCVDNEGTRELYQRYLAEIGQLDKEVGSVLQVLEEAGKLENTVVIFLAEQGPCMPFAKWTCYRYGQNSAFIARYPKKIAPGTESDALVQYEDVLPTLIDIAGGKPIDGIDGFSCLPVLYGKQKEHRKWSYGIHNNIPEGTTYPIRSIQDKKYKLIWNLCPELEYHEKHMMKPGDATQVWEYWLETAKTNDYARFLTNRYLHRPEIEFYDLEADPWELKNIATQPEHADRIALMKSELQKWMDEQGDTGVLLDTN